MFFYNAVVYCVLLLCAKVATSNEEKKKPVKDRDDVFKHTFAKLLKTIVTVNEERMQAMEKIIRLQDYMLTKNKLKTDDEAYDSMEEEDNRHLLTFVDMPQLRRTEAETITRAMCNSFNLKRDDNHLWTSQFLKMACHDQSVKICERACKKSVERLCEKFYCNENTRREFQNECHGSCTNYSEHDKE